MNGWATLRIGKNNRYLKMRYNIEKWTGKLDFFAFVPNLRASNNSEKLATPPGLIASLTVLITGILFF